MNKAKSAKKPASVKKMKALAEADLGQVSGGMEGGGGDCGSEGCGNDGGGGYEGGDYAGNERGCTLNDSQNGYRDCGGGSAG